MTDSNISKPLYVELDPTFFRPIRRGKVPEGIYGDFEKGFDRLYQASKVAKESAPTEFTQEDDNETGRGDSYRISSSLSSEGVTTAELGAHLIKMGVKEDMVNFVLQILIQHRVGFHISLAGYLTALSLTLLPPVSSLQTASGKFYCQVDEKGNFRIIHKSDIRKLNGQTGELEKVGGGIIAFQITPQKDIEVLNMSLTYTDEAAKKTVKSNLEAQGDSKIRDNPIRHPVLYAQKYPVRTTAGLLFVLPAAVVLTPPVAGAVFLMNQLFPASLSTKGMNQAINGVLSHLKEFVLPVSKPQSPQYVLRPQRLPIDMEQIWDEAAEKMSEAKRLADQVYKKSSTLTRILEGLSPSHRKPSTSAPVEVELQNLSNDRTTVGAHSSVHR